MWKMAHFLFFSNTELVLWRLLKTNCKVSVFTYPDWLCTDYLCCIHADVWLILPLIEGHRSSGCRNGNPHIMLNTHLLESLCYIMKLHIIQNLKQRSDFSGVLLENCIGLMWGIEQIWCLTQEAPCSVLVTNSPLAILALGSCPLNALS